jgi:hypothetical protein
LEKVTVMGIISMTKNEFKDFRLEKLRRALYGIHTAASEPDVKLLAKEAILMDQVNYEQEMKYFDNNNSTI